MFLCKLRLVIRKDWWSWKRKWTSPHEILGQPGDLKKQAIPDIVYRLLQFLIRNMFISQRILYLLHIYMHQIQVTRSITLLFVKVE